MCPAHCIYEKIRIILHVPVRCAAYGAGTASVFRED